MKDKTKNKEPERDWIFTFGSGHEHESDYVKIKGTFTSVRKEMLRRYGDTWRFQYSVEEWNAKWKYLHLIR